MVVNIPQTTLITHKKEKRKKEGNSIHRGHRMNGTRTT
jgi:hypothetical protein